MNDKEAYKQFPVKKHRIISPTCEYLIACDEQRKQKADVIKRIQEIDRELLKKEG